MKKNPTSILKKYDQPLIVAELGAKYANIGLMKQMIRSAKDCGADIVKFQTYQAKTISTPKGFFRRNDGSRVRQHDFFKMHELTRADHEKLIHYCKKIDMNWFSTPSHPRDVELLETFDPIGYKIGSDDLTNLPLLEYVAKKKRSMVVSTGMSTLGEVEKAVETVLGAGNKQLILLHCVVSYPSKPKDANLRVIETLRKSFGLPVGLSDHTPDEFTSILAAQLGAVIIEKHFTLDHALGLPDHESALDPAAFKKLVERVRLVPQALGTGVKSILKIEKKWRVAARKSIVSARKIGKGKVIQPRDLILLRPGDGIHPHHLDLVVNRRAACNIPEGVPLSWSMLDLSAE